MKPGKVRSIALCVFRYGDHILVAQNFDPVKKQTFYRPLGGTIEFGELAADTVRREIQEELGLDTTDINYLGTLENIFTYAGKQGHEIVMIFDGRFRNPDIPHQPVIHGIEGDSEPILAVWKHLSDFTPGNTGPGDPLYPTGLLEMLQEPR